MMLMLIVAEPERLIFDPLLVLAVGLRVSVHVEPDNVATPQPVSLLPPATSISE